jgi:hypothetical protein
MSQVKHFWGCQVGGVRLRVGTGYEETDLDVKAATVGMKDLGGSPRLSAGRSGIAGVGGGGGGNESPVEDG